jgi:hypothetical protein
MYSEKKLKYMLLILLALGSQSISQAADLTMTRNFIQAYQNGTRALNGSPGPAYWQNRADYRIQVSLDPITREINGIGDIKYFNNSPDTLKYLLIHLFPNIYKKGSARDFIVQYDDETDGVSIDNIDVAGINIDISENSASINYIHNDFELNLPSPLPPKQELNLSISWRYTVNKHSHMRTGQVDSSSYFIAYFYPRIAVYDDIDGWNNFYYSGRAEFYNDFGNFDVFVTVPQNYLVWATGTLQNSTEIINEKYIKRIKEAKNSDAVISIIGEKEFVDTFTVRNQKNTWHFRAENVTDFAFASSDHYLWDATSLEVDTKSKRRILISSVYNRNSKDFYQVAQLAREAIEFMSTDFPGVPFPYPELTVFNGLDEMEYPMMVNDLSFDDMSYVRKLTSHEIFHTYFPFYMGINESKYAWMDEGFASYGDYLISKALDKTGYASIYYLDRYKQNQFYDTDVPIMANSKYLKRYAYHYNAYAKPAIFLHILRDLLGAEKFKSSIHMYMQNWNGKHPTPFDFFFTLNTASGQNLNWLIKPWFFNFGYADLALTKIRKTEQGYEIYLLKKGPFPVPATIEIAYKDGSHGLIEKNVSIWKHDATEQIIQLTTHKVVKTVKLIPGIIPDADDSNNMLFVN